jgi:hypothetical protein
MRLMRSIDGELGAGAGNDHHAVLTIGADIVERVGWWVG